MCATLFARLRLDRYFYFQLHLRSLIQVPFTRGAGYMADYWRRFCCVRVRTSGKSHEPRTHTSARIGPRDVMPILCVTQSSYYNQAWWMCLHMCMRCIHDHQHLSKRTRSCHICTQRLSYGKYALGSAVSMNNKLVQILRNRQTIHGIWYFTMHVVVVAYLMCVKRSHSFICMTVTRLGHMGRETSTICYLRTPTPV